MDSGIGEEQLKKLPSLQDNGETVNWNCGKSLSFILKDLLDEFISPH